VNKGEQLTWEARWARPAASAAFVGGLLLLAHIVLLQSGLEDRPRTEPLPDFLLSIDDASATFVASKVAQTLAALLLIPVFLYLFRAANHRDAGMPNWFSYLLIAGPLLYAAGTILSSLQQLDVAGDFADRGLAAIRGNRGDELAEDLLREDSSGVLFGLSFAGSVAIGFMYVMLPLRARRVGLLSPFMSILGVVAGALFVLQLLPLVPIVVQAFWLGAVGSLYLGNWPGGRGPAWESGEPEPWPTPAQRRGLEPIPEREEEKSVLDPSEPPEPEPVPERPSSRKRRRRR
jgi:hypothetical protein